MANIQTRASLEGPVETWVDMGDGSFARRGAVTGSVTVDTGADSATLSTPDAANTNSTLLAASSTRKGFFIYNNSTTTIYVKYGATATSTSFTVAIAAGGSFGDSGVGVYRGIIDGINAGSPTGKILVTSW